MAPKKGTKREAPAAAPVPKKAKVDPAVEGVLEAISQASELPESCRKMLQAGVTLSLTTPQDQRHELQHRVVAMIGEAVEGVRAGLQQAVDTEASKLSGVEARRSELQAAVTAAEAAVAEAATAADEKATALAAAASGTAAAKGLLQEAQATQTSGDAALVEAKEEQAALEKAIAEDVRGIVEGAGEATKHFEALLPLLKGKGFDDSLMSALPSVCSKAAADRGAFDTMVLEQLNRSLGERTAALAKQVEEALPAAQERQAAVDQAGQKVQQAAAAEEAATAAASAAHGARQAAEAGLQAAKAALEAFEPEYKEASALRDEQARRLADFKALSVGSFEQLRDKVSNAGVLAGGA